MKRSLAIREHALGAKGTERFVKREPLYRVHECVFAVLALQSEAVDRCSGDPHGWSGNAPAHMRVVGDSKPPVAITAAWPEDPMHVATLAVERPKMDSSVKRPLLFYFDREEVVAARSSHSRAVWVAGDRAALGDVSRARLTGAALDVSRPASS